MSDLLIRLKLDERGLDAQLKGVSSKFAAATRGIAAIALPVAAIAGIARAVEGLSAIGEAAINTIAPLHDTAQQLGVTAERLQELRAVAGNAGVGVDQFDKALGILNRTLGQTALGQGQFEKIAKSAGISLRDEQGHIRTTAEVWDALTAKIQSGALSQNAAIGLASSAFGREKGGKMVAVLRQTAEEQQRVIDTARQFGAIISNEVVAAADEYEDKLALIKKGTEALGAQNKLILAPLTLAWADLKNQVVATAGAMLGVRDAQAAGMRREISNLEQILAGTGAAKLFVPISPQAREHFTKQLEGMKSELAAFESELNYETLIKTPFIQPLRQSDEDLIDPEEEAKKAKTAAAAELELVTSVYAEKDRLAQLEIEQMLEYSTILAEEKERVYASELEQLVTWNETLAAERERAADMEIEQFIQKEGLLTQARREGAEARAAFDKMSAGQQVATTIGALSTITAAVAQHSKKAFELNKLAAIANAIVNTAQGATKALAQGGFAGIAMAAAVIGAGAVQIAAIKKTTFQGGGAGTTPSAVGTMPVVNDQPVSQQQQRPTQTIAIEGVSADSMFSGRAVRTLLERIEETLKDGGGGKLVFVGG